MYKEEITMLNNCVVLLDSNASRNRNIITIRNYYNYLEDVLGEVLSEMLINFKNRGLKITKVFKDEYERHQEEDLYNIWGKIIQVTLLVEESEKKISKINQLWEEKKVGSARILEELFENRYILNEINIDNGLLNKIRYFNLEVVKYLTKCTHKADTTPDSVQEIKSLNTDGADTKLQISTKFILSNSKRKNRQCISINNSDILEFGNNTQLHNFFKVCRKPDTYNLQIVFEALKTEKVPENISSSEKIKYMRGILKFSKHYIKNRKYNIVLSYENTYIELKVKLKK